MITSEQSTMPEFEPNPHSIGIATTTFYKNWYPGDVQEQNKVDKIRGNLAIQMLREATAKGFQIAVVDGGSSDAFRETLEEMGIITHAEQEKGMSGSRRQAFNEISRLEGVKVIVWAEPEKVSIARDCLPEAAMPILQGLADIVIPKRDTNAFATYPDYQKSYELRANHLYNEILRKHNLLPPDADDLDVWFGPRLLKNDPEILKLFLDKYEFDKRNLKLDEIVDPELWPNAIFLPVVAALKRGFRVKSVPVQYTHPSEQTEIETDSEAFRRKRDIQYKNNIVSTMHLVRLIENNPKSRLHLST